MMERQVSMDDESTALYEIRLQGASAATLREQFPTATVLATRTETVLLRQVEQPGELDELIAELFSVGLVLTEVQELPLRRSSTTPEDQEGT